MNEYKIDYDMFDTMEIIKIIEFFRLIEKTKYNKVSKELLLSKYNEYRIIINNKSLEKKYDKMLLEKSNISIYKVINSLK